MSRSIPYNQDIPFQQNLALSNPQKDLHLNGEMQEKDRVKKSMDFLQNKHEQEKINEQEPQQQKYEDYAKNMMRKHSDKNNNQEKLNIELKKDDELQSRRRNFSQRMCNYFIDPSKKKIIYTTDPTKNFPEDKQNIQIGYSQRIEYQLLKIENTENENENFSQQNQEKKKQSINNIKNDDTIPNLRGFRNLPLTNINFHKQEIPEEYNEVEKMGQTQKHGRSNPKNARKPLNSDRINNFFNKDDHASDLVKGNFQDENNNLEEVSSDDDHLPIPKDQKFPDKSVNVLDSDDYKKTKLMKKNKKSSQNILKEKQKNNEGEKEKEMKKKKTFSKYSKFTKPK